MKKEELFRAIGEADLSASKIKKTQKMFPSVKILAACAAIAIVITGIFAAARADIFNRSQGGGDIAFVPTLDKIIYSGEPFSQSEIDELITTEGVEMVAEHDGKNARLVSRGFYLLSVTEDGNYMNYNVYILPAVTNGKVTSFLEIFRNDAGKLQAQFTSCNGNNAMTEALSKDGSIAVTVGAMWLVFITPENEIISFTGDASSTFSSSETEYIPREDYYSAYKTDFNKVN